MDVKERRHEKLRKREKKKKREENRLGPSYVDHLGFEFINSKSISSRDQPKNLRYQGHVRDVVESPLPLPSPPVTFKPLVPRSQIRL